MPEHAARMGIDSVSGRKADAHYAEPSSRANCITRSLGIRPEPAGIEDSDSADRPDIGFMAQGIDHFSRTLHVLLGMSACFGRGVASIHSTKSLTELLDVAVERRD